MKVLTRTIAAAFGVALVAAACDQGATSPAGTEGAVAGPTAQFAVGDVITKPVATQLGEQYVICKTGPSATFDVTAGGNPVTGSPFTVNDGECVIVYEMGGETQTVSSSENVPSGVQLDKVVKTQLTCGLGVGDECDPATSPVVDGPTEVFTGPLAGPTTSATFSGFVGGSGPSSDRSQKGVSGVLVEYFNSLIPTGGEGCTPGYWKQEHHFDSWTAPYDPTDLFSDFFEDAYPGMTLLGVLENKGNKTGLEALGRHTVAALLNAASSGVSYSYTPQGVIDAFNAVFPGTKDEYNSLKGDFASENELGCPLN